MGVEQVTTVRDRRKIRKIRASVVPDDGLESARSSACAATALERLFLPELLDLDDLAGAIRMLLAPGANTGAGQKVPSPVHSDAHLLPGCPRVSYVVEANEVP